MPSTWACYDPMSDAAVAQRREPGPIRFGSLNNPCKLNEPVLRLWARILKATRFAAHPSIGFPAATKFDHTTAANRKHRRRTDRVRRAT